MGELLQPQGVGTLPCFQPGAMGSKSREYGVHHRSVLVPDHGFGARRLAGVQGACQRIAGHLPLVDGEQPLRRGTYQGGAIETHREQGTAGIVPAEPFEKTAVIHRLPETKLHFAGEHHLGHCPRADGLHRFGDTLLPTFRFRHLLQGVEPAGRRPAHPALPEHGATQRGKPFRDHLFGAFSPPAQMGEGEHAVAVSPLQQELRHHQHSVGEAGPVATGVRLAVEGKAHEGARPGICAALVQVGPALLQLLPFTTQG